MCECLFAVKMGTVVGTCMPETEHHQTTHLSTIAPIRRRRYGKIELTPFKLFLPCKYYSNSIVMFVSPSSRIYTSTISMINYIAPRTYKNANELKKNDRKKKEIQYNP